MEMEKLAVWKFISMVKNRKKPLSRIHLARLSLPTSLLDWAEDLIRPKLTVWKLMMCDSTHALLHSRKSKSYQTRTPFLQFLLFKRTTVQKHKRKFFSLIIWSQKTNHIRKFPVRRKVLTSHSPT